MNPSDLSDNQLRAIISQSLRGTPEVPQMRLPASGSEVYKILLSKPLSQRSISLPDPSALLVDRPSRSSSSKANKNPDRDDWSEQEEEEDEEEEEFLVLELDSTDTEPEDESIGDATLAAVQPSHGKAKLKEEGKMGEDKGKEKEEEETGKGKQQESAKVKTKDGVKGKGKEKMKGTRWEGIQGTDKNFVWPHHPNEAYLRLAEFVVDLAEERCKRIPLQEVLELVANHPEGWAKQRSKSDWQKLHNGRLEDNFQIMFAEWLSKEVDKAIGMDVRIRRATEKKLSMKQLTWMNLEELGW